MVKCVQPEMKCTLRRIMQNIPKFNFDCTECGASHTAKLRSVPVTPTPSAGPEVAEQSYQVCLLHSKSKDQMLQLRA